MCPTWNTRVLRNIYLDVSALLLFELIWECLNDMKTDQKRRIKSLMHGVNGFMA